MTVTLGILRGVLDFYKQGPHTWTQHTWARDASGKPRPCGREDVVSHCLFSAVICETNRQWGRQDDAVACVRRAWLRQHDPVACVRRALREQLERDGEVVTNITLWNDDKDRWHGDVLSLLARTIRWEEAHTS